MKMRNLDQHLLRLLGDHHLLTANQLLEKLDHAYNKTSVYRALDRLLSEGTICRLVMDGKEATYELRDHHHDHAVCQNCGQIQEIACQENNNTVPGFTVDHHHTIVYGTCQKCQETTSVS